MFRFNDQCDELKKNGYFIMDDGQRSCDVPVKLKKGAVTIPSVKTRDRGCQTPKEFLLHAQISQANSSKSKRKSDSPDKTLQVKPGKRVRSDKQASPEKLMREISFGESTAKPSARKRVKIQEQEESKSKHQEMDVD